MGSKQEELSGFNETMKPSIEVVSYDPQFILQELSSESLFIPSVVKLYQDVFLATSGREAHSFEDVAARLFHQMSLSGTRPYFYVAFDDKTPVGFAWGTIGSYDIIVADLFESSFEYLSEEEKASLKARIDEVYEQEEKPGVIGSVFELGADVSYRDFSVIGPLLYKLSHQCVRFDVSWTREGFGTETLMPLIGSIGIPVETPHPETGEKRIIFVQDYKKIEDAVGENIEYAQKHLTRHIRHAMRSSQRSSL